MLTRPPALLSLSRPVRTPVLRRVPAPVPLPVQPAMKRWLAAPGSLTARLRLHGTVTVKVMSQGHRPLWPQEQRTLGALTGHVREVVLLIDGRPAVWARSSAPLRAVKGPWRAIKGLGTRPLAELLFAHRHVVRGPLRARRVPKGGPPVRHMRRQWQAAHAELGLRTSALAEPQWARHSLFHHRGQPLQVLEAFAPWVAQLSCVASPRHGD